MSCKVSNPVIQKMRQKKKLQYQEKATKIKKTKNKKQKWKGKGSKIQNIIIVTIQEYFQAICLASSRCLSSLLSSAFNAD